ncbi:hypothetical protein [Nocardia panacis]|uniref:hypothetical protein n=1 Tax=Nocardia panacis TaxID=2340916 RepID=UPI0011C4336E|nr:hypothetical protein [Nocardia panacis]
MARRTRLVVPEHRPLPESIPRCRFAHIQHWSGLGGPTRTLVRGYRPTRDGLVVIASELSDHRPGSVENFAALAEAFRVDWGGRLLVAPDAITWFAHHGDHTQPNLFTRIGLRWDGARYVDGTANHRLSAAEADTFLRDLVLDPVPEVLAQLRVA